MADETLLAKVQTRFQEIKLTRLHDGQIALYLDDAIQFVSGFDDQVYHGVLASLPARMLQGRPSKVLILGGGDGLVARNLLAFPNIQKVVMVELDPDMIRFSSTNPVMRQLNGDAFRNPRLQVTVEDARTWLARPRSERFDLAILDFPDPLSDELATLFSTKLYKQVMGLMNFGREIISVQSSGAYSETEDDVRLNLSIATQTKPITIRFRGSWMMDGAIILAGRGIVPSMTLIPDAFKAEPAAPDIKPKRRITVIF